MTKTRGQDIKKQGKKRAAQPEKARPQPKPSSGSWGSAAAAIASVGLLVGLLYASCRAEQANSENEAKPEAIAEKPQENRPAQRPVQDTQNPGAQAIQTAPPSPPPRPAVAPEDWNDAQIAWQPYDAGLAKAKTENKPVCLVVYTSWCPHCRNYAKVFHDPKVVSKAKEFVMLRVNADEQPAIANKHIPDGGYIPRTFFLQSDGNLMADVHAPRPQYMYFYDENNPAGVLGGMDEALKKSKKL